MMMAFLVSCLALVAFPMITDAKRASTLNELQVHDDMQAIGNASHDAVDGKPLSNLGNRVSKFNFTLKRAYCAKIDFGRLRGIVLDYPEAVRAMEAKGMKLANEKNCRLCDIEGKEGNLMEAKVTCNECFNGNGNLGWRDSDENFCIPCPRQCETCHKPTISNNPLKHPQSHWFKCLHPVGVYYAVGHPWYCEAPKDRKSEGQYQWCKYRSDLLATAYDARPSTRATWEVQITAARCDNTADSDENKGINVMMGGIKKKLSAFYSDNCELCQVKGGGRHAEPTKVWVNAKCAYDALGAIACRRDRGRVGWSKKSKRCLPCPHECTSCSDDDLFYDDTYWFKCNLQTTEGAGSQLEGLMLGKADEGPPELPKGFDCQSPVKKQCEKIGSESCMGYKTLCKYKENSW